MLLINLLSTRSPSCDRYQGQISYQRCTKGLQHTFAFTYSTFDKNTWRDYSHIRDKWEANLYDYFIMFRTCSLHVANMFRTFFRHVLNIFTIFRHVPCMFRTCFGHFSDVFSTFSQYSDMFLAYFQHISNIFLTSSQQFYHIPTCFRRDKIDDQFTLKSQRQVWTYFLVN